MEALEICKRPVVLFDFDGTVADTGRAVMTSTRKTLAARGFSEAQIHKNEKGWLCILAQKQQYDAEGIKYSERDI